MAAKSGDLPADFVLKTSVTLAAPNPAAARLFEDLGATSLNLPVDLTLPQIAAVRQAVDVPIDFYIESPDDFGGGVRYYEIPEMVRVAAPIYLMRRAQFTAALPGRSASRGTILALSRERVRRAHRDGDPSGYAPTQCPRHWRREDSLWLTSNSSTSTSRSGRCVRSAE